MATRKPLRLLMCEPTRCGVCHAPVVLATSVGSHSLLDDAGGIKVPHVCPEEHRNLWMARTKTRIQTSLRVVDGVFQGLKDRSFDT